MEEEHLNEIIRIDKLAFDRPEPRSISNLNALRMSDPEGCFVIIDGHKIVGYNYSKTIGTEGYLGPLGILPEYQNKGFGKALILKTIEYLSKNCKVIGLEVLPEKGNLLGLYQSMGFTSGFPSLLFQISEGFKLKKAYSNDFCFTPACEMTASEYEMVVDEIEKWTPSTHSDVYSKDLTATYQLKGKILVAFSRGKPVGFLAYSETLLPTLWGAVNDNIQDYNMQKEIMEGLLTHFNDFNGFEEIVLQTNSRHHVLVDLLIEMGFKIDRSINRMYLNGFEGDHLKKTNKLIIMPWRR